MEYLTTRGLLDANRKKEVSKNEQTCYFINEISKHLHLKLLEMMREGPVHQSILTHPYITR